MPDGQAEQQRNKGARQGVRLEADRPARAEYGGETRSESASPHATGWHSGDPRYRAYGRSPYRAEWPQSSADPAWQGRPEPGEAASPGWHEDGEPPWQTPGVYEPDRRTWLARGADEVLSWIGDNEAEYRRRLDRAPLRYRGTGPKGYRRADSRIADDVNDCLTHDHHVDATHIDVVVSGGEVALNGTVRDRGQKRRAEDVAHAVAGVTHVQNNLRIQS